MRRIKIITDTDFNLETKRFYKTRKRTGARGIVLNDEGKIAIFYKANKNEYKLPGGGVEEGEIIEDAFLREVLEETGCKVKIIKKLGTIEEHKSLDNFKQKSYVFVAQVIENTGKLNLTQKEIDEGGSLLWLTPEEAIDNIQACFDKLKPSKYEDLYHSRFIVLRDKTILDYYLDNIKGK